MIKPCLKWVGGKTQIINDIIELFPKEINNYHEPFLGGGSVLLALLSNEEIKVSGKIYAYDLNFNLISFYKNVQDRPEELVKSLKILIEDFNNCQIPESKDKKNRTPKSLEESMSSKESYYYWIRRKFNESEKGTIISSAMFLFINKTCFRGMYREGPKGFNVPYGNYKTFFIDEDHILKVSKIIKNVIFSTISFTESMKKINPGDFVYLDPPYVPETDKSFVGYNLEGFDMKCHQTLFEECKNIAKNGSIFVMSNSSVDFVKTSFLEFSVKIISCRRFINSKNPGSKTNEVLITNQ